MGIRKAIRNAVDTTTDVLEKTSNSTTRAGITVDRVAKMAKAGVQHGVIAQQLTANSRNGNRYTRIHVEGLVMLQDDAATKVGVTAKQATALTRDQKAGEPGAVSEEAPENVLGTTPALGKGK